MFSGFNSIAFTRKKGINEIQDIRNIALHPHLSLPTVSKIFKPLNRAGLLTSVRSPAIGQLIVWTLPL